MTIYHTIIFWEKYFYFFCTQMKKSVFLLGLLTTTVCLTACGSKNYEMSFDEALEAVSSSVFQEILSDNENVQQTFDIATNINNSWTNVVASIQTDSKQNTKANKSDSSIKINLNVRDWGNSNLDVNGSLNMKMVDETMYLNLETLNITWTDNAALLAPMVEWFKSQWFFLSMSGLDDMSDWYLKNVSELNAKTKEIIKNEGSVVYNWKFTQFNWYNAWKISLDNEKIQEIINEYYKSMNTSLDEEVEIPQFNIDNFEWYLVITWKDKVTVVIDNMDMVDDGIVVNANWFGGEDYALTLSSEWEEVITITANKKWSYYEVAANMSGAISLDWTVTPKISKFWISIKFDVTLIAKSEIGWGTDTVIPLKGSRTYEPISDFEVIAPESAQDLSEVIQNYLWWMFGWNIESYDEMEDLEWINHDVEGLEAADTQVTEDVDSTEETVAEPVELPNEVGEIPAE